MYNILKCISIYSKVYTEVFKIFYTKNFLAKLSNIFKHTKYMVALQYYLGLTGIILHSTA